MATAAATTIVCVVKDCAKCHRMESAMAVHDCRLPAGMNESNKSI